MMISSPHSFHIPVMGLGYTVDTPIKVAPWGISSVVSIMDDHLLEEMRKIYSEKSGMAFTPISEKLHDYRAERIKAYLNLIQDLVESKLEKIKGFETLEDVSLQKYLELLPSDHPMHGLVEIALRAEPNQQRKYFDEIREMIQPGSIDVNIMTKVDKLNYDENGINLPREYSDALSALRGFANSKLAGAVIFSAGMNPALYAYAEQFEDFFPDNTGTVKKRIILKVSDYRSALIQGKFLAKKGLWVSEFRIESGLNCGGHAFATDGFLIGPILEEFKGNKKDLRSTLFEICQQAILEKGKNQFHQTPPLNITYQGGIGTHEEDQFLRTYYQLDGTGWGSPFLLVPEATSVDEDTLQRIIKAKKSDYFLSHASPLGVPFNNLRTSSGEDQRKRRIENNRPGSPCYKKFLTFSTEFTEKPICTASRQYQNLKTKLFQNGAISKADLEETLAKDCLCEGLSAPAILANGGQPKRNLNAVTICPGPNLAYFKGFFSLKEMVGHIYGKIRLQLDQDRPHVFVKELQLYIDYLKNEWEKLGPEVNAKQAGYLEKFKTNLQKGTEYYQSLIDQFQVDTEEVIQNMKEQLYEALSQLEKFQPALMESK
jgi:hypothetical protein